MIRYTAKHSSGLTKTRTSKDHTTPRYTHAVWVDFGNGSADANSYGRNRAGWECRSIASEKTARYEAERYQKAGACRRVAQHGG